MKVCIRFHVKYTTCNIGIKQNFLCINICSVPIVVLKPEHNKQGFSTPRGLEDVNVSVNHVSSHLSEYCIKSFYWEFWTRKHFILFYFILLFVLTVLARKSMRNT